MLIRTAPGSFRVQCLCARFVLNPVFLPYEIHECHRLEDSLRRGGLQWDDYHARYLGFSSDDAQLWVQ